MFLILFLNFLLISDGKRVCKACVNSQPSKVVPKISRRLYFGEVPVINQFSSMVFVGTIDDGLRGVCGGTCKYILSLRVTVFFISCISSSYVLVISLLSS